MKKILSMSVAVAMLASMAALPANAKCVDDYSISYETIHSDVEIGRTAIPEGAIAITVNVENNSGFVSNTLNLEVEDGYTIVTDNAGAPAVKSGNVTRSALYRAACNENRICIATASGTSCRADGELFTFYVVADDPASAKDMSIASFDVESTDRSGLICDSPSDYITGFYMIGNVENGNTPNIHVVNASDAARILIEVYEYGNSFNLLTMTNDEFLSYFPDAIYKGAGDVNGNNVCDNVDAADILDYAAIIGSGQTYSGNIGRQIPFIIGEGE